MGLEGLQSGSVEIDLIRGLSTSRRCLLHGWGAALGCHSIARELRPESPLGSPRRKLLLGGLSGTGGGPSAQSALVIALSERHTPRAQNVVCGDGVEMEVGQRKRKDEGLRREGQP